MNSTHSKSWLAKIKVTGIAPYPCPTDKSVFPESWTFSGDPAASRRVRIRLDGLAGRD
jgi:hypothetical protein